MNIFALFRVLVITGDGRHRLYMQEVYTLFYNNTAAYHSQFPLGRMK